MNYKNYRHIIVTDKNYRILKGLGSAGDSFNDVISAILEEKINSLQSEGVPVLSEIVVNSGHSPGENYNNE